MMSSGKDTAMIILGKGKGKKHSEQDEMMDDDMEYDDEEEMEDYSEEQYSMADELITAVKSGNSERVLDAIHGIYNSY
jgi:hypothetical protein|tara:strand:+ start:203 stop:436 length:234 start_codon:yes stop_codon:yes gene_type:complete